MPGQRNDEFRRRVAERAAANRPKGGFPADKWLIDRGHGWEYPACGVCDTPILRDGRFWNPDSGNPGEDDYRCPDHPRATEWRSYDG